MAKTIFITGASSGLGKAAALLFADKGWHVIATMRSPENETDLGQIPNIHRLPLDVTRVSPGGIATDFASRSLVLTSHEAYTDYVNKVFAAFSDPKRQANASTAGQIADVVYEAATDGKDQLRYVAGNDAKALYAQRLQVGDEAFRQALTIVSLIKQPAQGRKPERSPYSFRFWRVHPAPPAKQPSP